MQRVTYLTLPVALTVAASIYLLAALGPRDGQAPQLEAVPVAQSAPRRDASIRVTSWQDSGVPRAATPSRDAMIAGIQSQLESLAQAQARLATQLQRLDARLGAQQDPDPLPMEAAVTEASWDAVDFQAEVSQGFDDEPRDAIWSLDAEQSIAEALSHSDFAGGELLAAECKATLCRVEVAFDSDDARIQMMGFLPLLLPWGGESLTDTYADDANHVVIYVARDGFDLSGAEML